VCVCVWGVCVCVCVRFSLRVCLRVFILLKILVKKSCTRNFIPYMRVNLSRSDVKIKNENEIYVHLRNA
jgi:hypothetical protein